MHGPLRHGGWARRRGRRRALAAGAAALAVLAGAAAAGAVTYANAWSSWVYAGPATVAHTQSGSLHLAFPRKVTGFRTGDDARFVLTLPAGFAPASITFTVAYRVGSESHVYLSGDDGAPPLWRAGGANATVSSRTVTLALS